MAVVILLAVLLLTPVIPAVFANHEANRNRSAATQQATKTADLIDQRIDQLALTTAPTDQEIIQIAGQETVFAPIDRSHGISFSIQIWTTGAATFGNAQYNDCFHLVLQDIGTTHEHSSATHLANCPSGRLLVLPSAPH